MAKLLEPEKAGLPVPFTIYISRKALQTVLASLKPAVPAKTSVRLLQSVMIEARPSDMGLGAIDFTVTDGEVLVRRRLNATVAQGGSACVPFRQLLSFVSLMPDEDIRLQITNGDLVVCTEHIKQTFRDVFGSAEFPSALCTSSACATQIPWDKWQRMVRLVGPTMNKDSHRALLTGVFLDKGNACAVSTDTHRLSVLKTETPAGSYVVRSSMLSALAAARPGKNAVLSIECVTGATPRLCAEIRWDGDSVHFEQVVLAGEFPSYQRVVPSEWTKEFAVDRMALLGAVRRAGFAARDTACRCRLRFVGGDVRVSSVSEEMGEFSESFPLSSPFEGDFEIAFNYQYLASYLATVSGDSVKVRCTEPQRPTVFACDGEPDLTYVLMPMALA